jgi:hypothetical protein
MYGSISGMNHNTDELLVGLLTQIRLREKHHQQQETTLHKGNNAKKQVSHLYWKINILRFFYHMFSWQHFLPAFLLQR